MKEFLAMMVDAPAGAEKRTFQLQVDQKKRGGARKNQELNF